MFKEYNERIRKILKDKEKGTDWEELLKYHKIMISRIQHERLIHLLVMIFVGIVMLQAFLFTISTGKSTVLLLDVALLILFIGYLFHYRFLENTTQGWYEIEDKIRELI